MGPTGAQVGYPHSNAVLGLPVAHVCSTVNAELPQKKEKTHLALSFAYFSKALAGTYMKSSITQIERRFDLSSSLTGLIDGGFEMGNLLFLAVVSHFGAKLHRPRLIAVGCFVMAVGSFLTGLPHFFMGRYKYDTVIQGFQNESVSIAASACVRDSSSHMWIYVFLGNALRGIGETPVTPLGISYIDDFAKAENSPFYIACLQTITLLGPMFGFLLGSYCAKLFVDIGYVDLDSVTISPKDARWVGAWWMGFLVSSAILFIAGIPFWFLPRSLPKQGGDEDKLPPSPETLDGTENALNSNNNNNQNVKLSDIAKGFLPSLRRLLGTPTYFLLLCASLLKFNSFIGLLTFKAKYMEQQFGQSASRANFLIGDMLFSECNSECSCSAQEWDPVCSENGITYISPCMAGCLSSSGYGKNTVFHNCSCVSSHFPGEGNMSVSLGQCPRSKDCSRSFTSYMAVSVLSSFINSLGATPGYMVIIRCISPELKSLALGIQTLVVRTLGGIPAPVYFGALIDSTCLKWAVKKCGGRGACRLYHSDMYRIIFLGLITCLSGSSYFFMIAVIILLRRQFRKPEAVKEMQRPEIELQIPSGPTEEQPDTPKIEKPPHTPKVQVRVVVELEEGEETHRTERLPQDGRLLPANNDAGEEQQPRSDTETAVEFTEAPSEGAEVETEGQKTEREVKVGEDKVCEEINGQVEREESDPNTEDSNVMEKCSSHSKETDGPQS
uniref:Solute carrier organic anion transporter family member n=1 Tax=Myripristis murdjan TaxID=586833 RepID=A0A667ZRF9_9TELE